MFYICFLIMVSLHHHFTKHLTIYLSKLGFKVTQDKKYVKYSRFGEDIYLPRVDLGWVIIYLGSENKIYEVYEDNYRKYTRLTIKWFMAFYKNYNLKRILATDDATKSYFQEERDSN